MKIKLGPNTRMAGPDGVFEPGAVVDVPEKTAQILIMGGSATLVGDFVARSVEKTSETAMLPPHAAATARPQHRKRVSGGNDDAKTD